jgi:hypothetical protein
MIWPPVLRVAIFIGGYKCEELWSCCSFCGDRADGVRAEECGRFPAEPGDSGELRFGDHAGGVRCTGESAEVQGRAGSVSEWLRGDCGEREVEIRISRAKNAREMGHPPSA